MALIFGWIVFLVFVVAQIPYLWLRKKGKLPQFAIYMFLGLDVLAALALIYLALHSLD